MTSRALEAPRQSLSQRVERPLAVKARTRPGGHVTSGHVTGGTGGRRGRGGLRDRRRHGVHLARHAGKSRGDWPVENEAQVLRAMPFVGLFLN